MHARHFINRLSFDALSLFLLAAAPSVALGQNTFPQANPAELAGKLTRPEAVVLSVLRSHPVTAPYGITTSWKNGAVVLSGRVGTSQVHESRRSCQLSPAWSIV